MYLKQQSENQEFEVPDKSAVTEEKPDYLSEQKENMHKTVQAIEAQNRWKVLENGTPDHDISQLKVR